MSTLSDIIAAVAAQPRRIRVGDVIVENHSIKDLVSAISSAATTEVITSSDPTDETALPGITMRKVVPL